MRTTSTTTMTVRARSSRGLSQGSATSSAPITRTPGPEPPTRCGGRGSLAERDASGAADLALLRGIGVDQAHRHAVGLLGQRARLDGEVGGRGGNAGQVDDLAGAGGLLAAQDERRGLADVQAVIDGLAHRRSYD